KFPSFCLIDYRVRWSRYGTPAQKGLTESRAVTPKCAEIESGALSTDAIAQLSPAKNGTIDVLLSPSCAGGQMTFAVIANFFSTLLDRLGLCARSDREKD